MAAGKQLMDMIFPRRCPLCNQIVVPKDKKACIRCVEQLTYLEEPRCRRCSKPILMMEQEYCFDCQKSIHHYEKGYAVFLYEGTIKKSLMNYKFKGIREYADFYVEQMIHHLGSKLQHLGCDAIIPVPIHKRKLRMRGFNQAHLLAKGLAEYLRIPLLTDTLLRTRYTIPQKILDDKERFKNLSEAFTVSIQHKESIYNRRILLVDDIYTTGSTMEACASILRKEGCKSVCFTTVCIGNGF